MADTQARVYRKLHCKAYTYTVTLKCPLEELEAVDCNCSICTINGCLFSYPYTAGTDFTPGNEDVLTSYFSNKKMAHKFCKICGTSVLTTAVDGEYKGMVGINVRTIHGIDVKSLKTKPWNGKDQ